MWIEPQGLGPVNPMRAFQHPGCDLRALLEAPAGLAGIPCTVFATCLVCQVRSAWLAEI